MLNTPDEIIPKLADSRPVITPLMKTCRRFLSLFMDTIRIVQVDEHLWRVSIGGVEYAKVNCGRLTLCGEIVTKAVP